MQSAPAAGAASTSCSQQSDHLFQQRCTKGCLAIGIRSRPRSVPRVTVYTKAVGRDGGIRASSNLDGRRALKAQILAEVQSLGTLAILPSSSAGTAQQKEQIDALIRSLEERDFTFHMRSDSLGMRRLTPEVGITGPGYDPALFGTWSLIYASAGTAVTRTGFAQAMMTAGSSLPGFGIQGIRQTLSLDPQGSIVASNEAEFGFGLLGTWLVGIDGGWRNSGDGQSVKVVFEKFKVKPVAVLGATLPEWLPQVLIALGEGGAARGGAEWTTSYLDEDFRVGKGKGGNLFLFRKLGS